MYTEFYGFTEEPFSPTPDPGFLFLSRSGREALAAITDGVERKKGFIVVTGEVGVGKTMILRAFLEKADHRRFKIVSLLNPNLTFKEMVDAILLEFGIEGEPGGVYERVTRLHSALIDEDRGGKGVVLMIDEAQRIPLETLKDLRMLSNLEASTHKLIQVILVGQPDLGKMLNRDDLRQFREHIAQWCRVSPLTRRESIKYIKYRLSRVTAREDRVFTRWALRRIVARAGGVPRAINILCDNVLMTGFGLQRKPITSGVVKRVIADLEGKPRSGPFPLVAAVVAGLFLVVGLAWWSPLKEIIPLRGPSQVGAGGMVISPIKEEIPRWTELETATPLILPVPKDKATPPAQRVEASAKPNRLGGIQDTVFPQIITVEEGDNLFRLTMKVYGRADERLMEWVLINNPQIKDPTRIAIGERIVFPERPPGHEPPAQVEHSGNRGLE